MRDLPEWLEEFTENLEDTEVPALHTFLMTHIRNGVQKWHPGNTVFVLTSRKVEIAKGTNMTRAPCRRRTGEALLRAEKFGDMITADHKVLSEGCESQNNHRYAVVVQDLATQWIQSYPCETTTSQGSRPLGRRENTLRKAIWRTIKMVRIFLNG